MTTPSIRADLAEAHAAVVAEWGEPGTWWTGAERLAIVAELRRARAADPLPPWVSPSAEGLVPDDHLLSAPAVDAIWRIANHAGTFTRDVYDALVARGLSPEAYVELVAVVATAAALDTFTTALGLPVYPLPDPVPGEPTRELVAGAVASTHWVPTVPGGVSVLQALSAVASGNETRRNLSEAQYLPAEALIGDLTWSRGTLDRLQIELIAARTSILNECFY
ncbi:MAG: hypothetical protein M5T61_00370 [Acidimicrobiia bacterium]|nr:hypothetical protein [Acidimicrobiia bacterium]